jgi:hypothetical protein
LSRVTATACVNSASLSRGADLLTRDERERDHRGDTRTAIARRSGTALGEPRAYRASASARPTSGGYMRRSARLRAHLDEAEHRHEQADDRTSP